MKIAVNIYSRYRGIQFLLILICSLNGCVTSKKGADSNDILPAASIHPYGRFAVNKDHGLEMISSAVHFGFSFEGTECRIFATISAKEGHNYLQYELDGEYQKRVKIQSNAMAPLILKSANPGKHTVWIYKATEASSGPIYIEKVTGKNIKPIKRPSSPIIEFIGNSITCGAAADPSEVPCGTGVYHDQHNAYFAYGPRVARALGTEFVLSSVSGIGVYRTWNADGPSMPQVYEKVDFQEDT